MTDDLTPVNPEPETNDLPEDIKALIAKKAQNQKTGSRAYYWIVGAFFVAFVFFLLLLPALAEQWHYWFLLPILSALSAGVCGYFVYRREKAIQKFTQTEIERLFTIEDKRVLGTLLDFILERDAWFLTAQRREHLQRTLSSLIPEDALLLTKEQKRGLLSLVRPDGEELTFVALKALEKIGDNDTLTALQSWKTGQNSGNVKAEVREAYRLCVEAIRKRLAAEKKGEQLLRPSSPSQQNQLLRATPNKPDENAETLLRVGTGEPNE